MIVSVPFIVKFERKYEPEPNSGCWIWIGAMRGGYGTIRYGCNHRNEAAHRVSFLIFKGLIPKDFVNDHKCKNKQCVNPEHLQAITQQENVMNGPFRGKNRKYNEVCIRGHVKTTMLSGRRRCRICENEQQSIRRKTD